MTKPKKKFVRLEVAPDIKHGVFIYECKDGTPGSIMYGTVNARIAFRMILDSLVGFMGESISNAVMFKMHKQTANMFEGIEGAGE